MERSSLDPRIHPYWETPYNIMEALIGIAILVAAYVVELFVAETSCE